MTNQQKYFRKKKKTKKPPMLDMRKCSHPFITGTVTVFRTKPIPFTPVLLITAHLTSLTHTDNVQTSLESHLQNTSITRLRTGRPSNADEEIRRDYKQFLVSSDLSDLQA